MTIANSLSPKLRQAFEGMTLILMIKVRGFIFLEIAKKRKYTTAVGFEPKNLTVVSVMPNQNGQVVQPPVQWKKVPFTRPRLATSRLKKRNEKLKGPMSQAPVHERLVWRRL